MKPMTVIATVLLLALAAWGVRGEKETMNEGAGDVIAVYDAVKGELVESRKVVLTDAEWRKRLPPDTYEVMRKHGTERPFSCGTLNRKEPGRYTCAGCGLDLFVVKRKFDSGTGWPSFTEPVHPNNIGTTVDYLLGKRYPRTEVHCARCGGHLGHVFDDGPPPTGLRYCINGVSLTFIAADE